MTGTTSIPDSKPGGAAIHLPGLNGLRAIAALAVVFSHITLSLGEFGLNPFILGATKEGKPQSLNLAAFGVSIFFALSGFLITFLLMKEKEVKPVNIKNFYVRRVLRIWPLYYGYFLLCLVTLFVYGIPFNKTSVVFYTLLAANVPFIADTAIPFLAHYWSLGVEEQFYAFWPWVVKKLNRNLLKVVIAATVILILLRIGFRLLEIKYGISLPYKIITVTRFQCMLIGAVGAILYYQKNKPFLKIVTHVLLQLAAWSVIVLLAFNKFRVPSFIDNEIVSAATVVIIIGQITGKNKLVNLENKVCDFIGKISYGIYVIHPLLIFFMAKLIGNLSDKGFWSYIFVYTVVSGVTITMAYLSYNYFEKPFLKIKQKFTVIKSSASKTA
jgi:peptidoglycan/LPS O-acetylase OafA/YrhL